MKVDAKYREYMFESIGKTASQHCLKMNIVTFRDYWKGNSTSLIVKNSSKIKRGDVIIIKETRNGKETYRHLVFYVQGTLQQSDGMKKNNTLLSLFMILSCNKLQYLIHSGFPSGLRTVYTPHLLQ